MRVIGNVTAFYTKNDYPSHHYICNFTVKGVNFTSMEQFLMYCKAHTFHDVVNAERILNTQNCQAQKMIGRDVNPYVDAIWVMKRPNIAFIGNLHKYRQNEVLRTLLLATGNNILVEASERDTAWGVGLSEHDDRIADPSQWRGSNLCGESQMKVREYLRQH